MAIDDTKKYNKTFITPERFDEIKKRKLHGPNGWILFAACNQGIGLAERVKEEYDKLLEANGSKLEYTDDDENKARMGETLQSLVNLLQDVDS